MCERAEPARRAALFRDPVASTVNEQRTTCKRDGRQQELASNIEIVVYNLNIAIVFIINDHADVLVQMLMSIMSSVSV